MFYSGFCSIDCPTDTLLASKNIDAIIFQAELTEITVFVDKTSFVFIDLIVVSMSEVK